MMRPLWNKSGSVLVRLVGTFRVQQPGDAQMLLCQVESGCQVVLSVGLSQLIKVNQIGSENAQKSSSVHVCVYQNNMSAQVSRMKKTVPVFMDECIEGHAVSPTGGEVMDVDIGVPEKKEPLKLVVVLFMKNSGTSSDEDPPGCLHLAPQQQGIFSRSPFLVVFSLHADVLNLRKRHQKLQRCGSTPRSDHQSWKFLLLYISNKNACSVTALLPKHGVYR